jgi:hypothetical protein
MSKAPRPLETVEVGGENGAPPSTESSDLGFLFCVCQRDDEPPGAGAPADLDDDDDDDDDDDCGEAENPFDYPVREEAAREGGAFGAVHEELVMGALVASRLAYSDANMTDALSDESLGPYAEGLDFVDKVPPSVPRLRRCSRDVDRGNDEPSFPTYFGRSCRGTRPWSRRARRARGPTAFSNWRGRATRRRDPRGPSRSSRFGARRTGRTRTRI